MPEDLHQRLREEARGSDRSVGATVIDLLRAALGERRSPADDPAVFDHASADGDS